MAQRAAGKPQRKGEHRVVRTGLVLGVLGTIVAVLAVFGIALGVAEWRMPDDNSDKIADLEEEIAGLEDEIADLTKADTALSSRVSDLETPLLPANRDIQELYARDSYDDCIWTADVELVDYEMREDEAFRDYVVDAITYAQYESAYDAYSAAYDRHDTAYDDCWETYLEESPFE